MIHLFIGTKAQLIKMAPVMQLLQQQGINYNFVFSGQHQATIKNIRDEFGIKEPDCILYEGPDITGILQMLMWSLKIIFRTLKNRQLVWQGDHQGVVLNHGDTFSTLLGTFLARICGLKSAHVESGLRSFNLFHPFPEEIIRRLVFQFSDIFFAPGKWAIDNLNGYRGQKINTENNTLLDALHLSENRIGAAKVDIPSYNYGVVSIHRFENIFFRKRLGRIIDLLETMAYQHQLIMILHKPTLIKLKKLDYYSRLENNPHIELRPRYSYFQFIKLIKNADFVVTDGGSNQEECYYLGKPCLIMRKATERQEGIGHNACLSKYQPSLISDFLDRLNSFRKPSRLDGNSPSQIIIDALLAHNQG